MHRLAISLLAFPEASAYLASNPDIVATTEGLAPQGAGTKARFRDATGVCMADTARLTQLIEP